MPKYVESQKIKNAKEKIVNRIQEFRYEWQRYSESSIDYHNGKNDGMEVAQRIVKAVLTDVLNAPSDDFVKVVRCKDCKSCDFFYPERKIGEDLKGVYYCNILGVDRNPDDYCSFGKRKDGSNG